MLPALLAAAPAIMGAAKAAPAGPSEANSSGMIGGSAFDNSGWNLTFGSNSGITAERTQATPMQGYLPYVLVGVAGLLAWRYLKKH